MDLTNEQAVEVLSEKLPKIDGKAFSDWPGWEGKGLPLRENCDLDNPRQALLWTFTAMPFVQGAPMMLGAEYWQFQSWQQWALGVRPSAEPILHYQPPESLTANQWEAAGEWVTLDTPLRPQRTMKQLVNQLPQGDKAELKDIIFDQLGINDESPQTPAGHLRVDDMARRLGVDEGELVVVLKNFGLPAEAHSFVSRDIAERITVHMGLD